MDDTPCVLMSTNGFQRVLRLNRPRALNALDIPLIRALHQGLKQAIGDDGISHIVIDHAEGKAFCAGGDIRAIYHAREEEYEQKLAITREEYALEYDVAISPKPVISLIDGLTLGAGAGLSLHSGYAVASENTALAMPEVRIGLFPDAGVSRLYAGLPRHLGVYLGLTAHRLNATDLLNFGLVRYAIPAGNIPQLKRVLSTKPAPDHDILRQAVHSFDTPADFLPQPTLNAEQLDWIADIFADDDTTKVINSVRQQAQQGGNMQEFARQTLDALALGSPLSLVLSHQLLRRKPQGLRETFTNDLVLAYFCAERGDFYEGVRALLIDKDLQPRWRYGDTRDLMDRSDIFANKAIFPDQH